MHLVVGTRPSVEAWKCTLDFDPEAYLPHHLAYPGANSGRLMGLEQIKIY